MGNEKQQHTPGPWAIHAITSGFREPNSNAGDVCIVAPSLYCPAICWGDGAEGKANAALISAAPDLLEVLCVIVDAYDKGIGVTLPKIALADAREAIKKATGET